MVLKMNNKNDNFYFYMGKFFGSRIVQSETKDRIYDDNDKLWYIYIDSNNKANAFISVSNNVIKNIYSTNPRFLEEIFVELTKDINIESSTVTNIYKDAYINFGFKVISLDNYKNFVMIGG